jgi:hypothetical protein
MGEEKICAPNPCRTESPFQYSLKNSVTTYVGTFELRRAANGGEVQAKAGSTGNPYITFLPKYEVKKASRNIPGINVPATKIILSAEKQHVDNSQLSDAMTSWRRYLQHGSDKNFGEFEKIEKSLVADLGSGRDPKVDAALVKVSVGSLDHKIRDSTVPILAQHEYVVFVFKEIKADGSTLFPWEFNVYPLEIYERFK